MEGNIINVNSSHLLENYKNGNWEWVGLGDGNRVGVGDGK